MKKKNAFFILLALLAFLFIVANTVNAQTLIWSKLVLEESSLVERAAWISDISGNGINDVIVGTDNCTNDSVYALEGETGQLLWSYPVVTAVGDIITLPDINGNGFDEVLFSNRYIETESPIDPEGPELYCVDGNTHDLLWEYTPNPQGFIYALALVDDATGDGCPDVIAGSQNYWVSLVDGTSGQQLWSTEFTSAQNQSVTQISDADDDGFNDVLVGNWDEDVASGAYCLRSSDGAIIYQKVLGNILSNCLKSADVTGDDIEEIIIGQEGTLYCFDMTATLPIPSWMTTLTMDMTQVLEEVQIMDDITGDGFPEVVTGSLNDSIYCVNGVSGDLIWTYAVTNWVNTVQVTEDINGDGYSDIIAGDQGLEGSGGTYYGSIYCINGYTGELFWRYETTDMVWAVTQIDDVNFDDVMDIIGCSDNGYVYCIEGDPSFVQPDPPTNLSIESISSDDFATFSWSGPSVRTLQNYRIYLDGLYEDNTTETDWLLYGLTSGKNYTAGVKAIYDEGASQLVTVDFTYEGLNIDDPSQNPTVILNNNYPNPFNYNTAISFSIAKPGKVTLDIYNVRGEKVITLIDDVLEAQDHVISWNGIDSSGSPLANGIYFYRINAGDYQKTQKMMLIK